MAAIMATLVVAGIRFLGFDLTPAHVVTVIAGALATQWACTRLTGLPRFDPMSALISGLGLSLLARTDSLVLALVTAILSIASKFVLRWNGKHVWNPTNLGLILMVLLTGGAPGHPGLVWVSPGQWGDTAIFAFALASIGLVLVFRAARSDVTLAFLAAARSAVGDSAPSAPQRSVDPVRVLHDFRPAHHSRFARGPHPVRTDRRAGRRTAAVRRVPPEWSAVGARRVRSARPAARPHRARPPACVVRPHSTRSTAPGRVPGVERSPR
jgi:hypothetical protein